jgi:uncharacterized protein
MSNNLIHETSPYLLQHAHNPVNWEPWSEEAFNKAKLENKLLIISIGYSACHWCHVMERESFEDEQVAKLMNDNFICIKVDREERPDVDQLFMDAAQLMIGRGGWPLNAFALPDGRPVYAGTYFPKIAWMGLLRELSFGYKKQPEKYREYADKLIKGISGLSLISNNKKEIEYSPDDIEEAYLGIIQQVDRTYGGRGRAPKFPMPHNWLFLLRYSYNTGNKEALDLTLLTLDKMALGGIYDQLGGGFSRYATDQQWKIPHFEKMLYDNVQLISLYSEAYLITHNELYKKIVYETISFLKDELMSPEGAFYCALDADSEGVEGKYYVWQESEINSLENTNIALVKEYFGIGKEAYWEHGNNILVVAELVSSLADKYNLPEAAIVSMIDDAKEKLLQQRKSRIRPGLDNKILLSWNALAIKGLIDAYKVFDDAEFLSAASKILSFIRDEMTADGQLYHSYQNGRPKIKGFLEDYAFYIEALISWYQVSFEEDAITKAKELTDYVIKQFSDHESGFFWFTSSTNNELATRKIETSDNVTPSANSVMAHNLHSLGILLDDKSYRSRCDLMLKSMISNISEQAAYFSNWAILLSYKIYPYFEISFTGTDAKANLLAFEKSFIPGKVIAGTTNAESAIPALKDKMVADKSYIYICENFTCQKPVGTVAEALALCQHKAS